MDQEMAGHRDHDAEEDEPKSGATVEVREDRVDEAVVRDRFELRAKDDKPGYDVPNAARENDEADDARHRIASRGFSEQALPR
jgi:hypothetical protein